VKRRRLKKHALTPALILILPCVSSSPSLSDDGRLVYVTHTAVGGRLYRDVELKSIKDNVILLKTLNYTAKDVAYCPSKEGTARYALVKRRLKEL
jgi:hypothetical protein